MILKPASHKAIKYAIMNWHYSKSIPVVGCSYSVFERNNWCGVICYGRGSNNSIAKPFGLHQGHVIELTRVALNGKQSSTSKAVSVSLRMIKKENPLVRLVVSYADIDQNHAGIIYQATNWHYIGVMMRDKHDSSWVVNNKRYHGRIISDWVKEKGGLRGLSRKDFLRKYFDKDAREYITRGKHKYIYPLDKKLVSLCERLSKPYPKQNASVA